VNHVQLSEGLFFVVFAGVAGFFLFRFIKYGGLRGALYGSRIARTLDEIDLGRAAGTTTTLRVHLLENGNVVVEHSSRALLGASIQGFPMNRENANRLVSLLKEATNA
jgi:hypothetical protein